MKINLKYMIFGIGLFIMLSSIIYDQYMSYEQNDFKLNFIIAKIETTPTSRLYLYNVKEKVDIRNYIISSSCDVEIGDLVIKNKGDERLIFYRKNNETKKYEIRTIIYPYR